MKTIILNPQEALLLDYEQNFQHLTSYEGYLSIINQQSIYESNQKGYERYFVQVSNNTGE
jgi:hypothetical protein